jgi:hypothetical protein
MNLLFFSYFVAALLGLDRRYWNRHKPTIPGWVAVQGKYRVFATEPIEDEV